ncbi:MAG: hypothetical protein DMG59_17650, partial [Acidobacteria bacterium]
MPHKRIRVLLIEDNPGDAKLVRVMLKAATEPGFEVQHVKDLQTGLAQMKSQDFDVLLLDLNLPDSQDLGTLWRAHAHAPSIPIVILTGIEDRQKAMEAMTRGAKDYLVKGKVDAHLLERAILRYVKVTDKEQHGVEERTEELLKNEHPFRLLVEKAERSAILMLDPNGRISSWNTGAERIIGYRADEIIGQHFSCFYPPEDQKLGQPAAALRVAASEGWFEKEGWRIRKDRSRFWANVAITALRDERGRLVGFSKVTHDLSGLKRAEEALQLLANVTAAASSGEDFHTAMSGCVKEICRLRKWQVGQVWAPDPIKNVLLCAPQSFHAELPCASFRQASLETEFKRGAGLPGRIWEKNSPAWIVDVTKDGNFPRARFAAEHGLKAAFGFPIRDGPNLFGVFEFFAAEIRDPDTPFLDAVDKLGDRLGEVLRTSEERFRAVSETAYNPIISANREGNIIHWNKAAERTFGYTSTEAMGKPLTLIMPERFHGAHRQGLERYLRTGEARVIGKRIELTGRRQNGDEFPIELSLASWETSEGAFFTGIIRDLTERKQAEQAAELARSNADLQAFAY